MPPSLYTMIAERLGRSGLIRSDKGWRRVIVEKPFGHDLRSARRLNDEIHAVFDEDQIYRIDHYMGKETVQNIMSFRFANAIFEPLWSRNYIDHVQISATESVGVGHRAGMQTRPVTMEFHYAGHFGTGALPDAYERLLLDALNGDASLFARADEIELAWSLIDPVLKTWEGEKAPPLAFYESGTWGPSEADRLLARDGRTWHQQCYTEG